jgi:hypothetical protein
VVVCHEVQWHASGVWLMLGGVWFQANLLTRMGNGLLSSELLKGHLVLVESCPVKNFIALH